MIWLVLALALGTLECPRLREICRTTTTGQAPPEWCSSGDLELWCPLEGAGLTVVGELAPPGQVYIPAPAPTPEPVPPAETHVPGGPPSTEGGLGKGRADVLEVRCSPRIGLNGYTAQMFARIRAPRQLYCPAVTVFWPDGTKSGPREADCDPLEDGEVVPDWNLSELWPNGLRFVVVGRMKVELEVRVGKVSRRGVCELEASGE